MAFRNFVFNGQLRVELQKRMQIGLTMLLQNTFTTVIIFPKYFSIIAKNTVKYTLRWINQVSCYVRDPTVYNPVLRDTLVFLVGKGNILW